MEFGLLGQVEIWRAGRQVPVGGPLPRSLLALLALEPGRVVGVERLADRMWDGRPPRARNALHRHVSQLRRLLGDADLILTRSPGYLLAVEPDQVDLYRFEWLAEEGRRLLAAGDAEAAGERLARALALWRGPALADLPARIRDGVAPRLEELRRRVLEDRIAADLAAGRHRELVGELVELVAEHPLRERLRGHLMLALYRCDRRADALEVYRQGREALVAELGLDPGPELQRLEQAILAGDPSLDLPGPAAAAVPGLPVPAQLPPDVADFAGRGDELDRLDAVLSRTDRASATVVVCGTAGVGKTVLAVHWARRVADRFPDGQLYVNLRGFDPAGPAMRPAEAVRGFLDALGVPPRGVPASVDAQVGLYRSLLAGRRVLVLLDNARDADQVRPLLPGSPGSLVVVTSRNQLLGLVAAEGAHPLTLDLPSVAEARELLARRLGPGRVAAEPSAVEEIIASCARLPLALAIVAARAAANPTFPLAALAGELHDARGGLDALAGGEAATDVRAVLSWSYEALSDQAARLFRLLGLHPGPDVTTPAAASLAAAPPERVRPLLGELARAHLLAEHAPGRFAFHDLLRAYATELARALDPDSERRAATHRMLDHYLHTAHAAAAFLGPLRDPIELPPPRPGVAPEAIADIRQALAWCADEHPVLLAALQQAARAGFDGHTWRLAWALTDFLERQGHWDDWAVTQRAALEAARRLGDRSGQAKAHLGLGLASTSLGRYDEAHANYRRALELLGALGDDAGQAHVHRAYTGLLGRQGRLEEALGHARRSLDLYRAAGHRAGQARALNNLGWLHACLGDYPRALTTCREALALLRELGDRRGEAATLDSLGYANRQLGRYREAVALYRQAVDLYVDLGDRSDQAVVLDHLGDTHEAGGDPDAARHVWWQALSILDQLGHPDADPIRAKLHDLEFRPLGRR